jgi:hypothetical protein
MAPFRVIVCQAAPFARLAGSDAGLLSITIELAEKAAQLHPDNANFVSAATDLKLMQCVPD